MPGPIRGVLATEARGAVHLSELVVTFSISIPVISSPCVTFFYIDSFNFFLATFSRAVFQ
jgi:hypothetical protein